MENTEWVGSGSGHWPLFCESLRDKGTLGDFIPQTPSLGTRPQTPSSLRVYSSFLSEKSMRKAVIVFVFIVC